MKKIKGKLTFANVTACLALFVALGGVSYAATQLPKNSVGAKQIKKSAVTPAKLSPAAKKALTGPAGATGQRGDVGPRGPQGDPGPKGDTGPSGLGNVVTRYGRLAELPTSAATTSYAACDPGESVVGGGWSFVGGRPASTAYFLNADRPSVKKEEGIFTLFLPPEDGEAATGWLAFFENNTGSPFEFRSYVQCAKP